MILKNSLIALLITSVSALAQGLTGVMVNSNGVVQRPTNFIAANNIATNEGIVVDFRYPIGTGSLLSLAQGANTVAGGSNGVVLFGVDGSTTNAQALVRLLQSVNDMGSGGVGTDWRDEMNFVITFDGLIRQDVTGGKWRTVIGSLDFSPATNIAIYPTNRAVGLELESFGGPSVITNRVRLIAHNGTTNTNGPWVVIGDIFNRHNIIIKHKGTNGFVELWHSMNYSQPTNITNATISGAPTAQGGGGLSAWDAGHFQPNTNNGNSGLTIWKAYWELIKQN